MILLYIYIIGIIITFVFCVVNEWKFGLTIGDFLLHFCVGVIWPMYMLVVITEKNRIEKCLNYKIVKPKK